MTIFRILRALVLSTDRYDGLSAPELIAKIDFGSHLTIDLVSLTKFAKHSLFQSLRDGCQSSVVSSAGLLQHLLSV